MSATNYAPFAKALFEFDCKLAVAQMDINLACRRGTGAMTKRSDVVGRLFDLHTSLSTGRATLRALAPEPFLVDSGISAEYIRDTMSAVRSVERMLQDACTNGEKLSDVRSIARAAGKRAEDAEYGIRRMLVSAQKLAKAAA
jgi:hypothetical protein